LVLKTGNLRVILPGLKVAVEDVKMLERTGEKR